MKYVHLIINACWVAPIDAKQSNLTLTSAIIAHATLGINTSTNSLKTDKAIDIIVAKIRQSA